MGAVAVRRVSRAFTPAKPDYANTIYGYNDRRDSRSLMRAATEGLILRTAAGAPRVGSGLNFYAVRTRLCALH
jgi:hypothetical protein